MGNMSCAVKPLNVEDKFENYGSPERLEYYSILIETTCVFVRALYMDPNILG